MNLTAPELVKQWRTLVNPHTEGARDLHLVKESLRDCTPEQMLLGMYHYQGNVSITIPMFLRQKEDWLEEDEMWAQVELAIYISHHTPPEYYIYQDLRYEEDSDSFTQALEARLKLREWASRILS